MTTIGTQTDSKNQYKNGVTIECYYFDHDTCALSLVTQDNCCHKEGYEEIKFTWEYRPRPKDLCKGHKVERIPISLYICKNHKAKLIEKYGENPTLPLLTGWDCWDVYEHLACLLEENTFTEIQL
jgi:hypothetical protein